MVSAFGAKHLVKLLSTGKSQLRVSTETELQ